MTARRRIVFNADDLGMGPAEDEGVLRAALAGIAREASLCVTGDGAERALERVAGLRDQLGIGLHLSLTFGRSVSGPLVGLTDASGRFRGLAPALASTLLGLPERVQVEREVRAQLARLRELGIEPTHLNGHHHAHVFPVVRDAVLRVAAERPGLHVRVPESRDTKSLRGATLNRLGRAFVRLARRRGVTLSSLPCLGLTQPEGDTLTAFARVLDGLDDCPVEWVLHPRSTTARTDDGGGGLGRRGRDDELVVLVSRQFRELLDRHGVEPSRYADV